MNLINFQDYEYILYFISFPFLMLQDARSLKSKALLKKILKFFIIFLSTILWIVATSTILFIFGFYKLLVTCILKIILGKKFKGLITGINSLTTVYNDNTQSIAEVFLFRSSKKKEDLIDEIRDRARKLIKFNSSKINIALKRFMGHLYKEEIDCFDITEVVKEIHVENYNNEELSTIVHKCTISSLPKNNKYVWDLYLGLYKKDSFIIIARMHHAFSDILGLQNLCNALLFVPKANNTQSEMEAKPTNKPIVFKSTLNNLNSLFLHEHHDHFLFDYKGNQDSHMVLFSSSKYVDKIKKIQKNLKGASLNVIIFTCFLYALRSHIIKNKITNIPEKLIFATPYQRNIKRFLKYYTHELSDVFENDFYAIPIRFDLCTNKNVDIESFVNEVNQEFKNSLKSGDSQVLYSFWKTFIEVMPNSIFRSGGQQFIDGTLARVPVTDKITLFTGDEVENVFINIGKPPEIGLLFTVVIYDSKLNFTFAGGESIFSKEDIENILKDISVNIVNLEKCFVHTK